MIGRAAGLFVLALAATLGGSVPALAQPQAGDKPRLEPGASGPGLGRTIPEPDLRIELSEAALNGLLRGAGSVSDTGIHTPRLWQDLDPRFGACDFFGWLDCPEGSTRDLGYGPGRVPLAVCRTPAGGVALLPSPPPVVWQWWVIQPGFALRDGGMSFTARVAARVGDAWSQEENTVGAGVEFDEEAHALRLRVEPFQVPLRLLSLGRLLEIGVVDVARLSSLRVPIAPQTIEVPQLHSGETRSVTARVVDAAPVYADGRLEVAFDVGF